MNPLSSASRNFRQLKRLPLLEIIDEERWSTLAPHISFLDLAEGERLFAAGLASESLFVIVEGEVGLHLPREPDELSGFWLQTRRAGATAGDFAVLNGGAHLVSAIAMCRCKVATFPRFAFELLTGINPKILAHVYASAAELSRRVMLARTYLELLGDVSEELMAELLKATAVNHYRSGDVLFEEGDPPDGLHVVVSGRLVVHSRIQTTRSSAPVRPGTVDLARESELTRVAEVRAPESVGELALLADGLRSGTVIAARESTVALLPIQEFHRLIAGDPKLLLSLTQLVIKRQLSLEGSVGQHTRAADRTFVVIPLDKRMHLRRFLHRLKRSLRNYGECKVLDSRGFDTLYGKTGASLTTFDALFNSAVAEWLDDQEERHDTLVYVADREWTPWTIRAINRADRILLLANADSHENTSHPADIYDLREVERELANNFEHARSRPRIELVLLHKPDTKRPKNTNRWLTPRVLSDFHHVKIDNSQHIDRLARRLAGKARGLVFSGGGARGYAHLGVQQYVEEQGIEIDAIGGSSMGALLGAAMAMGKSHEDVMELSSRFANKRALFDYTLPVASLMKSDKLTRFCQEAYDDVCVEDLWTPFFAVSSNLSDGRSVLHDRGPLWKIIRTSISLPGLFSPISTPTGDLLIDGAVLDSFPVGIMRNRFAGSGELIGVNVSRIPERFERFEFGTSLSGWRVLWSRIAPWRDSIAVPRVAETLLRATDVKDLERIGERRAMINVLVEPDVSSWSLLDFKHYKAISQVGYEEAKSVIGAFIDLEEQLRSSKSLPLIESGH